MWKLLPAGVTLAAANLFAACLPCVTEYRPPAAGTVFGRDGRPAANMRVAACTTSSRDPLQRKCAVWADDRTNPDGTFAFGSDDELETCKVGDEEPRLETLIFACAPDGDIGIGRVGSKSNMWISLNSPDAIPARAGNEELVQLALRECRRIGSLGR